MSESKHAGHVSELGPRCRRSVARDHLTAPSFVRELFRALVLDLIHPYLSLIRRVGSPSSRASRRSCATRSTRNRSSTRTRFRPRRPGLRELGALASRSPRVRRAGPSQHVRPRGALAAPGRARRRAAVGAPVDRRAAAVKLFGTEEQKKRFLPRLAKRAIPRSRSPRTTSAPIPRACRPRRCRPRWPRLHAQRREACARTAPSPSCHRHGAHPGKDGTPGPISVHRRDQLAGRGGGAAARVHGHRGTENALMRFTDVFVPGKSAVGRRQGLVSSR
jgi:hypothetical protein